MQGRTLCGRRGTDALQRCSAAAVRWRGGDLRSEDSILIRPCVSSILRLPAENRLRRHDCFRVPLLLPRFQKAVRRDAVAVLRRLLVPGRYLQSVVHTVVCNERGSGGREGRREGGGENRGSRTLARRLTHPTRARHDKKSRATQRHAPTPPPPSRDPNSSTLAWLPHHSLSHSGRSRVLSNTRDVFQTLSTAVKQPGTK